MGRQRTAEEVFARKAKKERGKEVKRAAAEAAAPPPTKKRKTLGIDEALVVAKDAEDKIAAGVRLASQLNPQKEGFNKALRDCWPGMPPNLRKRISRRDRNSDKAKKSDLPKMAIASMPFPAEAKDHCETSARSFADIAPLLNLIAEKIGKAPAELKLWDPYFCRGAVKGHLAALGFSDVRNDCEDFYKVIKRGSVPEHDVVITNPPYSDPKDGGPPHASRLLTFLEDNRRPYLVLMPEYVASAAYYAPLFPKASREPLFLCPRKRYHFFSPPGSRDSKKKSHKHKELGVRNSPFVAFWYVSLRPQLRRKEIVNLARSGTLGGISLAREGTEEEERGAEEKESTEVVVADAAVKESSAGCVLCQDLTQLPAGRAKFK